MVRNLMRFAVGSLLLAMLVTGCSDEGDGSSSDAATRSPEASAPAAGPPSVTVAKGASAVGQSSCSDDACAFIQVTTAGFDGAVSCRVADAFHGTEGFVTWTQGPNETKQSPNYYGYPNGWVEISCGDVTSPRFPW